MAFPDILPSVRFYGPAESVGPMDEPVPRISQAAVETMFTTPGVACRVAWPPRPLRAVFDSGRIYMIVMRNRGWDGDCVMANSSSSSLLVFRIGEQDFAVGVDAIECVLRAVEIKPLPEAPRGVRGVINLQGRVVPVFDLRTRFGQPVREVRASDHLLIAHTHWRTLALLVDAVTGVVPRSEAQITPASAILPDLECVSGVMKLDGGLVLVHDVERFLSIEDHEALQMALDLQP